MNSAARLRKLIEEPGIISLPGSHDVLSAMLYEQAGFDACFTTGYGLSATTLGLPDYGFLTQTETMDRVRRIVDAVSIPVVADMDTGYGNPLNVIRTVEECVRAGAAGVILEDQLWPKRCGHMAGKSVIPMEEHVEKLRAAVHARGDSGLVIIARTDSRATHGLDEALRRGHAYADAGADVVFIEAPETMEELRTVTASFDVPLFANMIEGGRTPFLPAPELEEIGFKIVVYPLSGLFATTKVVQQMAARLKNTGTTDGTDMVSFDEFYELIGVPRFRELETRFAVEA